MARIRLCPLKSLFIVSLNPIVFIAIFHFNQQLKMKVSPTSTVVNEEFGVNTGPSEPLDSRRRVEGFDNPFLHIRTSNSSLAEKYNVSFLSTASPNLVWIYDLLEMGIVELEQIHPRAAVKTGLEYTTWYRHRFETTHPPLESVATSEPTRINRIWIWGKYAANCCHTPLVLVREGMSRPILQLRNSRFCTFPVPAP